MFFKAKRLNDAQLETVINLAKEAHWGVAGSVHETRLVYKDASPDLSDPESQRVFFEFIRKCIEAGIGNFPTGEKDKVIPILDALLEQSRGTERFGPSRAAFMVVNSACKAELVVLAWRQFPKDERLLTAVQLLLTKSLFEPLESLVGFDRAYDFFRAFPVLFAALGSITGLDKSPFFKD